jgi:hypothetical protein
METIRVVCGHDCPGICLPLSEVEDGRVVRMSTWLDVSGFQAPACKGGA